MLRQYELIEKIRAYDPDADEGLINRADRALYQAKGSGRNCVRVAGLPSRTTTNRAELLSFPVATS